MFGDGGSGVDACVRGGVIRGQEPRVQVPGALNSSIWLPNRYRVPLLPDRKQEDRSDGESTALLRQCVRSDSSRTQTRRTASPVEPIQEPARVETLLNRQSEFSIRPPAAWAFSNHILILRPTCPPEPWRRREGVKWYLAPKKLQNAIPQVYLDGSISDTVN